MSMHDTIQSLLHANAWTADIAALWDALRSAYHDNRAEYEANVLPLVLKFREPLCLHTLKTFSDLDEVEQASQIVPLPCFGLSIPCDQLDLSGVEALADKPLLQYLNHLELQGEEDEEPGAEGVQVLVDSPHLSHVIGLSLIRFHMGVQGVELICRSPKFAQLQTLNLSENELADEGLRPLAEAEMLKTLKTLTSWGNDIRAAGVEHLHGAKALQKLSLSNNPLGPEGARALRPLVHQLELLDVDNSHLEDEGLRALAEQTDLGALEHLYMNGNRIGDAGLVALAQNSTFSPLGIQLNDNEIGDEGIGALASGSALSKVVDLEIYDNNIGDEGMCALASARNYPALENLSIQANPFGDKGMMAMVDHCQNFPELGFLVLADTKVTERSMKHLAQSPFLRQLEDLHLDEDNDIGPEGWEALLKSPHISESTAENLRDCYEG